MRYLRGGVLSDDEYRNLPEEEKTKQVATLQKAHAERLANMTQEERYAYDQMLDEEDEHDGGGRRRYHRRKQSKSRSRKH
jgi:hypothetical protein